MKFLIQKIDKLIFYLLENKLYDRILAKLGLDVFLLQKELKKQNYIKYYQSEKIRIAFLIQFPFLWKTYDKLIKNCLKNPKVDTHLILSPLVTLDEKIKKKYILQNKKILLKENLKFKNYENYSLEFEKPHIIFIQQPYEEFLPYKYSVRKIINLGIRICYIQYGGEFHFNFKKLFSISKFFLLSTWCIFSRSKKNKSLYEKYLNNKNVNIILTGNPKYDHFFDKKKIPKIILDNAKGKKVLFWATAFYERDPSFSKDCSFFYYQKNIFEFIKKNKDIFLVFKPHPYLWKSLVKFNIVNNNQCKKIIKEIKKIENLYYDDNINYIDFFKITDYLISDNNSILLSFYITGKPVIFLKQPTISFNNNFYDFKKSFYVANNMNQLKFFINNLDNNLDPLKDLRQKLRNQNFDFLDGKSSVRILNSIFYKLLDN